MCTGLMSQKLVESPLKHRLSKAASELGLHYFLLHVFRRFRKWKSLLRFYVSAGII